MATLVPTQPVRALTPTSPNDEERGVWDYAVPLDGSEVSFLRVQHKPPILLPGIN
jgi:hypothetical protein